MRREITVQICIAPSTINYIIRFLFGEQGEHTVAYSDEPVTQIEKPIVIRPSTFFTEQLFGKPDSMPNLPLKEWHGIPILFGEPSDFFENGKLVIEADIISSAFFLLSRYEEVINPERDSYGRFSGKRSLPGRAGFLHRPVVDEYAAIAADLARRNGVFLQLPCNTFDRIYLTHDVDSPWDNFTFLGMVKRIAVMLLRDHNLNFYPIRNRMGCPEEDPIYTFEDIIRYDSILADGQPIYFFKSGAGNSPEDGFDYLGTEAAERLIDRVKASGAKIGYHVSFEAGKHPKLVKEELSRLRKITREQVTTSRNHYLRSMEPRDYFVLIENGIEEDFTMGYADAAGFRLGTSRAVHWISPYDGSVTPLVLHPLTIMECSLSGKQYMNLSYEEMKAYSFRLIDACFRFGGEVTLLWHNNNLMKEESLCELYLEVLEYLTEKRTGK